MSIRHRAVASLSALAVLVLVQSPAEASRTPAPARASATCRLSSHDQRGGLGPSYVTSLSVSSTSCSTGIAVVKAYYRCRVRSGGPKGRCHSSVLGFHCSEQRTGIAVQFDAKVSCASGNRRVYHTYVQDT
jgi:hypothetical protein